MKSPTICDPCRTGEGLSCVLRIASDEQFEEWNTLIHNTWSRACTHYQAVIEITEWKASLTSAITQLQTALKDLDDALDVATLEQGSVHSNKKSFIDATVSCLRKVENVIQEGLLLDCGNGSCTVTYELLRDFIDFSCSLSSGNVCAFEWLEM